MKKIIILSLLWCSLACSKHIVAQEIVGTEWSGNLLMITYSPTKGVVSCTAYNSEEKGIGGSVSMSGKRISPLVHSRTLFTTWYLTQRPILRDE